FLAIGLVGITISSIITIAFVANLIFPFYSVPEFTLSSFRIMKVEDNDIYADFSLNFSKPIKNDILINKVNCLLLLENSVESIKLAEGITLSSFIIPKNITKIENLSFLFIVPDVEMLMEVLLGKEKITITGNIIFPLGIFYPFTLESQEFGDGFFPAISIQELHPVPPGSQLEVLVEVNNPHDISLNISEGQFQLFTSDYGNLGLATLDNISMLPRISNVTLFLESNKSQLTWMFEKILNNGTIQVKMRDLEASFDFAGKKIDIFTNEGPFFTWESFSPSLQIRGVENINPFPGEFDLMIGLEGEPLWGYNISYKPENSSGISLDFYHKLLSNPEPQIVGSGTSNSTVLIKRNTQTIITIHVTVDSNAIQLPLIWLLEGKIEIDIRNGILNLQFYDVLFEVGFSRTLIYDL
ncbi:MAG: hypothetical protein ACXACR_06920, partial [Candidatus Hodarchaeales archaeon]